ncbi:MAG: hypothetical protein JKY71_06660 [Alphaproteobacteria bacterium]|nr:hypothetical protein [Alphaproteobacteria bacterium]
MLRTDTPTTLIESRLLGDTGESRLVSMQSLSLRERFSIVSDILDEAEAKKIKYRFDVDDIAVSALAPQVQALINISRSFEPSEAYEDFLDDVTEETIHLLGQDKHILGAIQNWHLISDQDREETLTAVHAHTRSAANIVVYSPDIFDLTEMRFFDEGIEDGLITNGYFRPATGERKNRHIAINENPRSKFYKGVQAAALVVHETMHDQEDQIADIVAADPYGPFSRFEDDAEITRLRREFSATIPTKLFPAYRRQWHEVLARRCEDRVCDALTAMTNG